MWNLITTVPVFNHFVERHIRSGNSAVVVIKLRHLTDVAKILQSLFLFLIDIKHATQYCTEAEVKKMSLLSCGTSVEWKGRTQCDLQVDDIWPWPYHGCYMRHCSVPCAMCHCSVPLFCAMCHNGSAPCEIIKPYLNFASKDFIMWYHFKCDCEIFSSTFDGKLEALTRLSRNTKKFLDIHPLHHQAELSGSWS